MGRIVRADAAYTVTIPVYVTGSRASLPEDVKQDGQETCVIDAIFVFIYLHTCTT